MGTIEVDLMDPHITTAAAARLYHIAVGWRKTRLQHIIDLAWHTAKFF